MNKLLLPAIALALTAALTGCGNSRPTPEETMAQEAMSILRDELPPDATQLSFIAKYNVQHCSMSYADGQSAWGTLARLPAAQFPVVLTAKKDDNRWKLAANDYRSDSIDNQTGGLTSEIISATEFRRRVQECVQLSAVRRRQLYSTSIRAANALSWAQAGESRTSMPTFDGHAIMELQDREAILDQHAKEFSQQVTVTESKDGDPSITFSDAPTPGGSESQAIPALERGTVAHPVATQDLP